VTIILIAVLLIGLVAALAMVGMRSRTIFTNPGALPDRQIAATIEITRKIMARTSPRSSAWARAAAQHKAAIDEQLRRKGEAPFDNIELTGPGSPPGA
jgi:Tfp pilus assembly protein PilV